jgi:hypothetical protein
LLTLFISFAFVVLAKEKKTNNHNMIEKNPFKFESIKCIRKRENCFAVDFIFKPGTGTYSMVFCQFGHKSLLVMVFSVVWVTGSHGPVVTLFLAIVKVPRGQFV